MRRSKPPERLTEGQARDSALRALARREHSAAELRAKLARRGHTEETVEGVVDALAQHGWQSDTRYAETLVRSRLRQGYGPLRIEHELAAAGITDAEIRDAIRAAEADWAALCTELRQRKFPNVPRSAAEWQKQYRFLAGRGFTNEHIRTALKGASQPFDVGD